MTDGLDTVEQKSLRHQVPWAPESELANLSDCSSVLASDVLGLTLPPPGLERTFVENTYRQSLEKEFNVEVRPVLNTYGYFLEYNGTPKLMFKSSADADGLKEGRAKLEALAEKTTGTPNRFREICYELLHDKDALKAASTDEVKDALQEVFGLTIVDDKHHYQYHLHANGVDTVIATTNKSKHDLNNAFTMLKDKLELKEAELTKEFNVHFGNEDEVVITDVDKKPWNHNKREWDGFSRMPRFDDLEGVQAALSRAKPYQLLADDAKSAGLNIYFLKRSYYDDASAFYIGHRKSIFFEAPESSWTKPTEADTDAETRQWSVEAILIHELGHNAQIRLGLSEGSKGLDQEAVKIGWHPYYKAPGAEVEWLMQAKNGMLFYRDGDSSVTDSNIPWIACNEKHQMLRQDGTPALSTKDAYKLSNEEMKAKALVAPITGYFTDPREMLAEGVQYFLTGPDTRRQLLKESPALYAEVKELDQKMIALTYAGMLRGPDAKLVANTPENQCILANWEEFSKTCEGDACKVVPPPIKCYTNRGTKP